MEVMNKMPQLKGKSLPADFGCQKIYPNTFELMRCYDTCLI